MQPRFISRVAHPILFSSIAIPLIFGSAPLSYALTLPDVAEEHTDYYLTDHLGSTDAVLDSDGKVRERSDNMPFGSERAREASPNAPKTPQKFTGKELDDETGLNYYGARYYDSSLGRFVSMDPLVLGESSKSIASVFQNPQVLNGYSYALNNPSKFVDKTGQYNETVHDYLTHYLALKAGIDETFANRIAWFDQSMDRDPTTSPGENLENAVNGNNAIYHFVTRATGIKYVEDALKKDNPDALGEALHSFQDSYAHQGLWQIEHAFDTKLEEWQILLKTDPDQTQNDIPKAREMAYSTFMYMRTFQKNKLCMTDDEAKKFETDSDTIWSTISPDIEQFISSTNKRKDGTNVMNDLINLGIVETPVDKK